MQVRAFLTIISQAYRVDVSTVEVYSRSLKAAQLLTGGIKGPAAPHLTPHDAAVMTIALLATDRPARAVEMVRRFCSIPFRPDRSRGDLPPWLTAGGTIEDAVTQLFSLAEWPIQDMPYLEVRQNNRSVVIELTGDRLLFFQDQQRTDEQKAADRKGLLGIRRAHGLASAELMAVWMAFRLEQREGISWERLLDRAETERAMKQGKK